MIRMSIFMSFNLLTVVYIDTLMHKHKHKHKLLVVMHSGTLTRNQGEKTMDIKSGVAT